MSEHASTAEHAAPGNAAHPAAAVAAEKPLFTERQLQQFDSDDGDAGRAIGKMLVTFFLYTVIAMSLVAWWTLTRG